MIKDVIQEIVALDLSKWKLSAGFVLSALNENQRFSHVEGHCKFNKTPARISCNSWWNRILKENINKLCKSLPALQNRKICFSRSDKRRKSWFLFTIVKISYFRNSFHRITISLINIIWVFCGRECLVSGPNRVPRSCFLLFHWNDFVWGFLAKNKKKM